MSVWKLKSWKFGLSGNARLTEEQLREGRGYEVCHTAGSSDPFRTVSLGSSQNRERDPQAEQDVSSLLKGYILP